MPRRCSPVGKILAPLALLLVIHNLDKTDLFQGGALLGAFMYRALVPLISMLASVGLGIYSKSPLIGLLSLIYLKPQMAEGLIQYQWYILSILGLGMILVIAYLRGPWDSALEAFTIGKRYYMTPVLASITSALILARLGMVKPGADYWPFVLGGGLLLSRIAVNPLIAIAGGAVASLGVFGVIAISLYASFTPVPPLYCRGLRVGRLVGYEIETSTTRIVAGSAFKRWRARGIACSHDGDAVLAMGWKSILWIYSSKPLKLAQWVAKANRNGKRIVAIDLDKPGETDDVYSLLKYVEESGRDVNLSLGAIDAASREGILLALPESIKDDDLVVISSCIESPRSLQKYLSEISKKTLVIASFCKPESDLLAPARGPEGSGVILGPLGDPLLTATVLGRLFPDTWRPLSGLIEMSHRTALAYAYCSGGWALVEVGV
ncbi:MAG: hypothetical protein F7C38_03100 [Desulfurococcales archaeon]|nr:hypothetical protein [Desulfurococcales archaeon]